jgi:N-acetylgalactosamine kinase
LTGTHKTCLPVCGKPVIARTIEALNAAGVSFHVVVVGAGAEHVLKTVGSAFSDVPFAYQPEPLGTGNAAKYGAALLSSIGYDGDILILAGDKLIETIVVRRMVRRFRTCVLDCLFLVGRRENSPESGRVIFDESERPVRIIETADIRRARVFSRILAQAEKGKVSPEFVARTISSEGMNPQKARLAFGQLCDFAAGSLRLTKDELTALIPADATFFRVPGRAGARRISPDEADASVYVNLSVYLLKAEALQFALKRIQAENAQCEEYLPDIIEILARPRKGTGTAYRLGTILADDRHPVLGFNSLEELRRIEEWLGHKESRL